MNRLEELKEPTVDSSDTEEYSNVTNKSVHSEGDRSESPLSLSPHDTFDYSHVKYEKPQDVWQDEDSKVYLVKSDEEPKSKAPRKRILGRRGCLSSRGKHRKTMPVKLLRNSIERRVEGVERILEDRIDNFLEENSEKYPCLQKIEHWIADRKCKGTSKRNFKRSCSITSPSDTVGNEGTKCEGNNFNEGDKEDSQQSPRESLDSAGECRKSSPSPTPVNVHCEAKYGARDHSTFVDKMKDGVKEKVDDIVRVLMKIRNLDYSIVCDYD